MQVTNSAAIVDYFPEAFIAEADDIKGMKVTIRRFIKRVYFRATGQKSYSVVKATDAKYDWSARINNGSTVTDFNTDKMPRSEYMPLMCWFMSLIKHYLHTQMTDQLEIMDARSELMADIVDIINEWDTIEVSHDQLKVLLCNAVLKNFPTKWSWLKITLSTAINSNKI